MKRSALIAVFLGFAGVAVVAGCGSGTKTTSLPVTGAASNGAKTAQAILRIVVPPKTTSSDTRKPAYVSPDTNSVSVSIAGGDTQVFDLTGGGCTTSGGTKTCSESLVAPIGANETMAVSAFNSTDGSGSALSLNSVPVTVVAGTANSLSISLNGVVASYGLVVSPTSVPAAATTAVTATFTAYDAQNDAIVGPGTLVDSTNTAVTPSLGDDDSSGATSIGALSGNSWTVTETNPTEGTINFTVSSGGSPTPTNGSAALTVVAAATPTPSPTPTPTPTPAPTATPNAILNGTFSTGDLTDWYICYGAHTALSTPVNPSPAPTGAATQTTTTVSTPRPEATPYTPLASLGTQTGDASVQTVTPTVTGGFSDFALVGHSDYPYNAKGNVGICQDVVVPSNASTLSFSMLEGGNDAFATADTEADIYPSGSFSSSANGAQATTTVTPLFAQENCYNNLGSNGGTSVAWGGSTGSARAKVCGDQSINPWPGGQWYQRTFSLASYTSGTHVTVFLGLWHSAASGSPSNSTYYIYTYFANVSLTP